MLKNSLWLIIASLVAIFFKNYLAKGLTYLIMLHNKVVMWLSYVFSTGQAGQIIQGVLALILIPVAIGLVVNFLYWAVKRSAMPHAWLTVWVVWIVLLVTLLAQVG